MKYSNDGYPHLMIVRCNTQQESIDLANILKSINTGRK